MSGGRTREVICSMIWDQLIEARAMPVFSASRSMSPLLRYMNLFTEAAPGALACCSQFAENSSLVTSPPGLPPPNWYWIVALNFLSPAAEGVRLSGANAAGDVRSWSPRAGVVGRGVAMGRASHEIRRVCKRLQALCGVWGEVCGLRAAAAGTGPR